MGEYFVHLLHILTFIQSAHKILVHPNYVRTFVPKNRLFLPKLEFSLLPSIKIFTLQVK